METRIEPGTSAATSYRTAVKNVFEAEIKSVLDEEMRKAAQELAEEQKNAIRQIVEEQKKLIREVVEEEKRAIWTRVEELRRSIENL